MTETNQPIHKGREGNVHFSIWEKTNEKGTYPTVKIGTRYKKGDEWKDGNSYLRRDLEDLDKARREIDAFLNERYPAPQAAAS